MSEYNAMDGSISGPAKGKNFYMGGKDTYKPEKGSAKIILDNAINKDLGNDLVIEREKREVKEYNQKLVDIDPKVENIVLNGNNLMIRLFKHNPHIDNGLIKEKKPIKVRFNSESGKVKEEDAYLQFIHRGVIVNMSGKYSDNFTEKFGVGDIIDVKIGVSLEQQMCFLDTQEFYHKGMYCFENYFTVNENMIDKKIKNYTI